MSFPGNYNINYYRGDTLEFRVRPRNADGSLFNLGPYTPIFTIATVRGDGATQFAGYVEKSTDNSYILCAIEPETGLQLSAGTTYVYDVQITDPDLSEIDQAYDRVYTILTGNITVTEHVSGAVGES
jgi:hypothetical protein